ncbi:MAG: tripartite tricarboxylate transporter permease [Hyphomicrobiaceae bacterium]|nr:tripartite tricarboxylate transporter permease [Hyphomicrobiaceae bacterium]
MKTFAETFSFVTPVVQADIGGDHIFKISRAGSSTPEDAPTMEFIYHFGPVFTLSSLAILCAGTFGGLLLGATPGLSPTMAVALLIPFTFHMDPAQGLMLLGAAYTATVAGGAVSAILLKIPGAPANIATALDGYEMARKGEGAKALQLCFISSFIGGVLGVLVLIFLTPLLAQWALSFGPSHLFWIAILGVTIIGSLDSKSVIKGLLAGCIGLWIAMIGYDSVQGVERFIFSEHLEGGVHIIAALIGLFAIPQVIEMLEGGRNLRTYDMIKVKPHNVWDSVRTTLAHPRTVSIGSIVGIIIGLIPGAGGQIAGLVAYDQSKRFSPKRKLFGTGEPEGVIAAETANNAMVGPSLVPLLTLSVPGSPTAAVLLGGLLIHGIFPGPNLFEKHADVAWAFINSLLIGQLLMMLFGLYIAGLAAHVVRVPPAILASAILVLAVFGAYSVQNSMSDVVVMLVLGIGMYFLQQYGYSAAPLVLGVILGPIAESNYVQGRIIASAGDGMFTYFCTGTMNLILIALVIASVGYSFASEFRTRQRASEPEKTA